MGAVNASVRERRAKRALSTEDTDMVENRGHDGRKMQRGMLDGSVPRSSPQMSEESAFAGAHSASASDMADDRPEETPKLCRSCKQRPAERLYTSEELREIVQRALMRREGELRAEYDQILQARLSEQFNNFRRFHEDYVSRQLNQSSYSYMS